MLQSVTLLRIRWQIQILTKPHTCTPLKHKSLCGSFCQVSLLAIWCVMRFGLILFACDRDYCTFITFLHLGDWRGSVKMYGAKCVLTPAHENTQKHINGAVRPSLSMLTVRIPQQWNSISAFWLQFIACAAQLPVSLSPCTAWRSVSFGLVFFSLPHSVTLVL